MSLKIMKREHGEDQETSKPYRKTIAEIWDCWDCKEVGRPGRRCRKSSIISGVILEISAAQRDPKISGLSRGKIGTLNHRSAQYWRGTGVPFRCRTV
jgi:hypothetical protein